MESRRRQSAKYYSPLRYPGGKGCIFPFVSKLFYENDLIGINYAEPFAGGAGLALRLLMEEYVRQIHINDLDKSIYSFWYAVLNYNDQLCHWILDVDVSMKSWYKFKEVQEHADEANLLELAKATFFLNRTNVSGVLTGGVIGGKSQTGKYKIDVRFNKPDLVSRIQAIAKYRDRIQLSKQEGKIFINKINSKPEDCFIYLDPPYLQKGADLYMNFYFEKDHRKLAQQVKSLGKLWMVSYDYQNLIVDLYSEEAKILYQLSQCASNRVGDEIMIFSNRIIYDQAILSLRAPVHL